MGLILQSGFIKSEVGHSLSVYFFFDFSIWTMQ